ncbi:MAG: T9SS type A sorting domain-containing protein [Bacteroidetes bacterium]|jgi:uncharacterized protein (TIGR02145 family)|nr:T9SS type A sorting domain-containing protein [Bacteroidota bacterium]MBT4399071.1 T9SS type A sorting domain-containing protein [Bacteroidota bacterium]MBT4411276.1 T9SS type A sorting domain-containing protein [Bacteroidota bacterium]MBT7093350.1 T9SS type A sorting domain-containing protein [Bacteroidota bacterium]MBT7465995.1 T9SS type A sorting domain-containing protein [Bacteroidota bacterium]
MKTKLLLFLLSIAGIGTSQDFVISFTSGMNDIPLDSIMAENIRTGETVTFSGDQNLVLATSAGIDVTQVTDYKSETYPNPFSGQTTFNLTVPTPTKLDIRLFNSSGQLLAYHESDAEQGVNSFALSVKEPGHYSLVISHEYGVVTKKLISIGDNEQGNQIQYTSLGPLASGAKKIKSTNDNPSLEFILGDCIRYTCFGDIHAVLFQEEVRNSKAYKVIFYPCVDPEGQSYSTVIIGSQVWMAENLAYLPAVSQVGENSYDDPHFFVHGYSGNSVSEAKALTNYSEYGVLYNWAAANTACPSGWRLPSDDDCKTLEHYMGMHTGELQLAGWRQSGDVGKKLKSCEGWLEEGCGINSVGFNVIPAGWKNQTQFEDLEKHFVIWNSSYIDNFYAYTRGFDFEEDGVYKGGASRNFGGSVRCVKDD